MNYQIYQLYLKPFSCQVSDRHMVSIEHVVAGCKRVSARACAVFGEKEHYNEEQMELAHLLPHDCLCQFL